MAEEITFKLRAISDFKDITSNIDALRKKFQELKMPTDTYKGFDKTFTALEAKITSAQEKLKNGFRNGSEINSFKRDLSDIKQLYAQIGTEVKGLNLDEVFKGVDSPELEDARRHLADFENQLKQLLSTNAFTKLDTDVKKLEEALGRTARKGVGELIDNLKKGDFDTAAQKVKELQQAIAKMSEGKTKEAYTNFLTQIGLNPSEIGTDLEKIKAQINQVFNGDQVRAAAAGIEEWQTKVHGLEISNIEDLENVIKQIIQELMQSGQGWTTMQHGYEETIDKSKQLNSELDQFKNRIAYFFGMNNAVRLFQRALRSAYETVKDLDKVMTETAVVTDFTVSDMWEQLPEYTARANELGLAIHDVYEASTLYYQQGLKTNEVMAVTNATLRMARIASLDAAEATDRITNALRGFNMEITEANANNIADVYSKLAAMSASNVDEISTAMTKVASLANNANMEFETTAAFLAQIIETTRESAETAGTALKTVVARFSEVKKLYSEGELLGNDEEGQEIDVNKVSTALRTAGINLNEFLTGQRGLDEIFMELASKWDSLTIVQQRYIATMAAGSRQQSRFIALMSDYARTQELVAAAQDANGASQAQYEKTLDSLETKLNQLKNAWDEFVMGLAKDETIKWVVDALTDLIGAVNKLTANLPGVLKTVSRLGIAFGALKGVGAIFNGLLKNVGTQLGTRMKQIGEEGGKSLSGGFKKAFDYFFPTTDITEKLKDNLEAQIKSLAVNFNGNSNALQQQIWSNINAGNWDEAAEAARNFGNQIQLTKEQTEALVDTIQKIPRLTALQAELNKIQQGFSTVGSAAMGVGAALMGLSRILGLLGFDRAAEATQKWGTALLAVGAIIPLLGKGIKWLGETAFKAGIEANLGWGPFYAIVMGVIAALAVLAVGLVQVNKAMHPARENLKGINSALETCETLLNDTKSAVDNLASAWDALSTARENLESLTFGTEEWRKALSEVNQQVLELVTNYPELAQYVIHGENGGLAFDEEGYRAYSQRLEAEVMQLARTQLGLQARAAVEGARVDTDKAYNQHLWGSQAANVGLMAGGTILGAGNPLLWNAGLSAILGGAIGSITSDILDRNQWNELLNYASNNNISSFTLDEDAKDLREYLTETQNLNNVQAGLVINQIRHLGTGFDQLINQIQTANVQLDNAINVMVSDIVSDSDDLTDANRQFIKTVSEMTDIGETYNTAYEDALNNLPAARFWNKTALRQMYAENVGGTYEGGVLRDQNGEQLDLSTGEMRQAIAAATASDQLEANVNSFVHNLVNSTDEALKAVMEGTANQDQFVDVQNRINDIASEYRLNLDEFQAYINKINESISTIPPVFLNTFADIPVQILANLSSSLENASDGEKRAIAQSLNEIIKNVSPEVAEKIMAAFATTDFSKITNIDAFFAGLEDLVPGVNFASESLAALRQAAIEAGDATAQLSQTLLTQFASLRDKVANRERNGFTAEDLQTLRESGLDTEALFVQTGEDAFRFIGEFGELSEAISQGYNKVINDQIQSVDSVRERAEEAEQAYLDAQAATQAAQEALDEQTADIETANKKMEGLANELRNGRFGNIFQILSYEITNGIATILEDLNNIFFGGNEDSTFGRWAEALRANNENGSTGYTAYDNARQALEDAQLAEEDAKSAMEVAQDEIKNSLDNGVSAIQQAVASGDFSALHLDEILNDPALAQAFDNALIGALYEYEDLISLADELRNATDEASRSTARLNAALQLTAKQNQKLYENLAKAITDSADALAGKDVDPAGYKKAIDKIVKAARDAFGDNPIITPKFVEDNLSLFQDFANGSIDAVDSIREALTDQVNGTLELTNDQLSAVQTAMSSLDGASFETEGYMDASQLFTTLANIMGGAEEAANYLRSLGYTIEWKQTGEAPLTIPDPNNPGKVITAELPNYEAIVTDGFGNIANTNRTAGLGSGGGGGGGSSKDKTWKNPYDELYNLTEDINENLRERNHLEDEYGRIVDRNNKEVAAAYKNNLQARENLYQERRYRDQELAGRRNQLRNIGNRTVETEDGYKTYTEMDVVKYARYNDTDNTVEIDWDGIDKIEDTEIGKAVEQYVKDLEELQGQIEDTEDRIIEIDDDLWELEQRGKEEALDMEKRLAEALKNQQQKVIDEYQELSETIDNTNSRILDGLQESIDLSRQIRDNTKTEEDIAQKEARLAYLRRDTSGANALEIQQLQKELDEARQSYSDTLIDQSIDRLSQDNQKAADQRAQQIDIMQSQLDYAEEIGEFNRQAEQMLIDAVMNEDFSEIEAILKADERFDAMSSFAQGQWTDEFRSAVVQAYEGAMNFLQLGSKPTLDMTLSQLGNGINSAIQQASSGSGGGNGPGGSWTPSGGAGDTTKDTGPSTNVVSSNNPKGASQADDFKMARTRYNNYVNSLDGSAVERAEKAAAFLKTLINDLNRKWGLTLDNTQVSSLRAYKTGGLADFTGPAWLDGTKSHPELVLNAKDTENFIALRNILSHLMNGQVGGAGASASGDINLDIDINVDQIANDYDVDRLIDRVKQNIYQDASYRNINQINFIR